jgi:hypothetical protein
MFTNNQNNFNQPYRKDVLKFLSMIKVDTRFISLYDYRIYINNLRFSKFSRKKEEIFRNKFPNIEIFKSTIFQKIAIKSSKSLSQSINVKDNILIFNKDKKDTLSTIIMEPYLRKYGIKLIESNLKSYDEFIKLKNCNETFKFLRDNKINGVASSLTLDEEVKSILSTILYGEGLKSYPQDINFKDENGSFKIKILYPFIKGVDYKTINRTCEILKISGKDDNIIKNMDENNQNHTEKNDLALEFMNFLEEVIPYYKENILKSTDFLKSY